ncbi:hypothetical protein ABK040_007385 [Willaertia magna]
MSVRSHFEISNVITFQHQNKQFHLNSFPDINKIAHVHNNTTNTLFYLTKDGKAYIVEDKRIHLLNENEEIKALDAHYSNHLIVKKDAAYNILDNNCVKLPIIESDDKFIKIISSGKRCFVFLLTEKGKVFGIGENIDEIFGKDGQFIKKNEFTLLNNLLDTVTSKIVDIQCGYTCCTVRCENGDCYGAGYNYYLNIGIERQGLVTQFTLLDQLKGKVKQHACGNFHGLYLTFDNEVYGCGVKSR